MPVKMSTNETDSAESPHNIFVYLDIKVGEEKAGRMVIELFKEAVPRTVENFRALCTGEKGVGSFGKPLHYKGNTFHRVIPQFLVQSGDVTSSNGEGGESIYGRSFDDENFQIKHDTPGIVGMANCGPNTNNSQFYITAVPCNHLDGRNVAFGQVRKGLNILMDIYEVPTKDDKPLEKCTIEDCGVFKTGEPWNVEEKDMTEDVYPPWPNDWEKHEEAEVGSVIERIKESGNFYFNRRNYVDSDRKYKKALRYIDWAFSSGKTCDSNRIYRLKVNSLLNLAAVRLKKGKCRDVIGICNQVLGIEPENGKAYYRRAQAKMALNEYDSALKDYSTALSVCPNDSNIRKKFEAAKKQKLEYTAKERKTYSKLFDF